MLDKKLRAILRKLVRDAQYDYYPNAFEETLDKQADQAIIQIKQAFKSELPERKKGVWATRRNLEDATIPGKAKMLMTSSIAKGYNAYRDKVIEGLK